MNGSLTGRLLQLKHDDVKCWNGKTFYEGAFLSWNTASKPVALFYNSKMPSLRLKFTIMHELGHACLWHRQDSELAEIEANTFAATALCPLPLIECYGVEDAQTLAHVFEISAECAERRITQFWKWQQLPLSARNVTFDRVVCSRFKLKIPYQPSLFSVLNFTNRKCS